MMIGSFREYDNGYTGSIFSIALCIGFVAISRTPAKSSTKGPDYVVLAAPSEEDGEFEIGAAWDRVSKAGKPYVSVKLDGPTIAQPFHCALIEQQRKGSYGLIWKRSSETEEEAAV